MASKSYPTIFLQKYDCTAVKSITDCYQVFKLPVMAVEGREGDDSWEKAAAVNRRFRVDPRICPDGSSSPSSPRAVFFSFSFAHIVSHAL